MYSKNSVFTIAKSVKLNIHNGVALVSYFDPKSNMVMNYRLTPITALILNFFDGNNTIDDIVKILKGTINVNEKIAYKTINKLFHMFPDVIVLANGSKRKKISPIELIRGVKKYNGDDISIRKLNYPKELYFDVTTKCNYRCVYCYKASMYSNKNETEKYLTTNRWQEITAEASSVGCTKVTFMGGDPILNPNLLEYIEVAAKNELETITSTRSKLEVDYLMKLKDAGLNSLQVSIDSCKADIVTRLTGLENAYDDAVTTIEKSLEIGLDIGIKSVITKYNIEHIPQLIYNMIKKGIKRIAFNYYSASAGRHNINLYPTIEQIRILDEKMISIINNCGENIEIDYVFNKTNDYNKSLEYMVMHRKRCAASRDVLCIKADGTIGFCDQLMFLKEFNVGDLNKQDLMEIWNSEEIKKLIEPNREAFKNTDCYQCNLFERCYPRRCFLRSYLHYGTPFEKDPWCPYGEANSDII